MGACEQHPSGCESIDVGSPGVRMPTEAADPVIQIVYSDEQDIGFFRRSRVQSKAGDPGYPPQENDVSDGLHDGSFLPQA